jgi:Domain of unknown function (DUF4304)
MSRKNPLQNRVQKIFKAELTPTLDNVGFTKHGIVYTRDLHPIVNIVDVQQSFGNTLQAISFTLNCGIYVPGVKASFWNAPEPQKLCAANGIIDMRLGSALLGRIEQWWDLKTTDGLERDAEIGLDIRLSLEQRAFPLFDRFREKRAIAEFLSQPRRKEDSPLFTYGEAYQRAYAAILWRMLGDQEQFNECLEQAVALSRKTPGKRRVDEFVARCA